MPRRVAADGPSRTTAGTASGPAAGRGDTSRDTAGTTPGPRCEEAKIVIEQPSNLISVIWLFSAPFCPTNPVGITSFALQRIPTCGKRGVGASRAGQFKRTHWSICNRVERAARDPSFADECIPHKLNGYPFTHDGPPAEALQIEGIHIHSQIIHEHLFASRGFRQVAHF